MHGKKISLRVTDAQLRVLDELSSALNATYSQLIRAILFDFIERNEERLERIITNQKEAREDDTND